VNNRDQSYSGHNSYRYVEPVLKEKSDELMVISPYIGDDYARMLVDLGKSKRVRVITSEYSAGVKGYAKRYSKESLFEHLKPIILMFILIGAAIYLRFYEVLAVLIVILLILLSLTYVKYKRTRHSNFEVRLPYERFVHEKMYISRRSAAVGSANLTFSGMHSNLENVQLTTDREKIDEFRDHFDKLWEQSSRM